MAAAGAASARQRTPVQRCARLLSPILVALVYAAYKMATVGVEDEHSVTGAAQDGALTSFKVLSAVQVSDLDVPLSTGTLPRSPRLLAGDTATEWLGTQVTRACGLAHWHGRRLCGRQCRHTLTALAVLHTVDVGCRFGRGAGGTARQGVWGPLGGDNPADCGA